MSGFVSLVGAGPGDPELLTLRALRRLRDADLVLNDALVQSDLLELAPKAQRFYVGKRAGRHSIDQEGIHRLLIRAAKRGQRVVRLKCGDPFVLGRGGEEVQACIAAGVPVEVVPGVTSALAVPAAAGIPVTHRGLSRQLTILSAHDTTPDWATLARLEGTLILLMGVAQLGSHTRELLAHGKDPGTPVAVVERGTLPSQRTTVGTLADIAARARARGVANPAVVVIGDVAALADVEAD